jgi:hypothetical protein
MEKISYNQIDTNELELVNMRINGLLGGSSKFIDKTNEVINNGTDLDTLFDFYIDEDGDVCTFKKGEKI